MSSTSSGGEKTCVSPYAGLEDVSSCFLGRTAQPTLLFGYPEKSGRLDLTLQFALF